MKIRKLLCILCALSVLLTLTACNNDQTSIPKGDKSNTEETSSPASTPEDTKYQIDRTPVPESIFQLNGKDCRIVSEGAKLSQYPEPYCSLKKDEMIKAGGKAEIRNDFAARPFYKIWLTNDQETDCAYADAWVSEFFLMGGEPGDMVYSGITFGQTEEETDALAEKASKRKSPNEYNGASDFDALLRNLLFKELGEDWIDQIKWVDYESKAEDNRYYRLNVIFVEGKVYAMGIDAYYSILF